MSATRMIFAARYAMPYTSRAGARLSLRLAPTATSNDSGNAPLQRRSYANKQNMQSTAGQASPGTASNVTETGPGSASSEQQSVKASRGKDSSSGVQESPDSASLATPVSGPKGSGTGQQEDDADVQGAFKQDPGKSRDEKRENVEKMGERKLDPADE
ncbi:hypothetical protein LTR84_002675 [Exophiala bonariae]|uniref:Uncharacterized protein n=1 Tax=Exophiala bonariae TaxID=1690606 RepID=A0AAV9NB65_9EURO|nr:hypothetical protein LTR84_002675 [Exophiala bonariae]